MALGYPAPPAEGVRHECVKCGSDQMVLDATGQPLRCKECGAVVADPFAS